MSESALERGLQANVELEETPQRVEQSQGGHPGAPAADLSWQTPPGAPHVRLAYPEEASEVQRLAAMAATGFDPDLAAALRSPEGTGTFVSAGMAGGPELAAAVLARFIDRNQVPQALLSTATAWVVEGGEGLVGTLVATCPPAVLVGFLRGARGSVERRRVLEVGASRLVKITRVAVEETMRGQGIGWALVQSAIEAYSISGFGLMYGQCDAASAPLARFYMRHGFTMVPPGKPLDLTELLMVSGEIRPEPGERFFYRVLNR